jgi:UDP-N-acetylglucosamine/UDP-N-acetylgalactosamine diphosphorylase
MTSGATQAETQAFFEANDFFGLKPAQVKLFEQGQIHCLTTDGKVRCSFLLVFLLIFHILLSWPQLILDQIDAVSVSPDGNGGLYASVRSPLGLVRPTTPCSHLTYTLTQLPHDYHFSMV